MSVYVRRRLVAGGILVALVLGVVAMARGGGEGGGEDDQRAGKPRSQAARGPDVRPVPDKGSFFVEQDGQVAQQVPVHPGRRVAITFDDGPGPQTTAFVRELQRLDAPATFFLIGEQVAARPEVARQVRDAGMLIGNHSYTHPPFSTLSQPAQREQIARTQTEISLATDETPRFFRPPDWIWNQDTARALKEERMVGVLNTVEIEDWRLLPTDQIVREAKKVRAGGIIALHDAGGSDRTATLKALGPMIRDLRRRHLEPVTVDRLYDGPPARKR